jgi:Na+-translocating ferredoxin:NAD+ oxidoreductase RnfG subunit
VGSLLELFGSISTIIFSFIKEATEEEIDENIKFLTEYKWFQDYLDNETFGRLIKEHEDVRRVIGNVNSNKLKTNSRYYKKAQKKIHNVLLTNKTSI